MNNHKKDRRDDERKPKRRGTEERTDRKPYGNRDAENRTDRKPYRSRNSEERTERRPYESRNTESNERGARSSDRADRKPYGSRDTENRAERKPYRSRETNSRDRGDRRDRNEGSFERSSKKYNSDKPRRKSSTSRTPAPKPGPFDKFDVQKMREAKAESLEKKERKRPSRRGAEDRSERKPYGRRDADQRTERRPYERRDTEERTERKPYGNRDTEHRERGVSSIERVVRKERSFDKPEGDNRFERPTREERIEKKYTKKESTGFERKKTNPDDEIRLNRYIANSGVCSRRKADELIEKGEVTVNGEVVRELGYKVKYSDKIKFEGKLLKPGKLVYVLLNKPKDFITTMDDPMERRTVVDLTTKITSERIFPVGRLDRNTTGLLLLTNDGDLADKLSHPRNQVKKVYEVELDKSLIAKDFEKIREGVELEDGNAKVDQISYLDGKSKKFVGVEIHIGRNRIVRRIFESLGYEVVRLDRVIYAGLTKKDLPRGRSRMLTKEEIIYLKHLNKY